MKRKVAHIFPKAHEIIKVTLDFRTGALRPGGADNHPHALRDFHVTGNFLEAPAVARVGDLAGNAAAARCVRHENAIASGEREIGCERRTLVAAFLLDHLHEDDLAAFDDFLDLVLAARRPALASWHFFQRVFRADGFDLLAFGVFFHRLDADPNLADGRRFLRLHVRLGRSLVVDRVACFGLFYVYNL